MRDYINVYIICVIIKIKYTFILLYITEHNGIYHLCGIVEIDRRGVNVSLSSGEGSTSGSSPQLQGYLGLRSDDMEVRRDQGFL